MFTFLQLFNKLAQLVNCILRGGPAGADTGSHSAVRQVFVKAEFKMAVYFFVHFFGDDDKLLIGGLIS